MKSMQRALYCRCGKEKVLAHGLCVTCYTLKRQDEEYFGGLREKVLERDGYRCRVCDASGRDKRSIIVHHRVPGKSVTHLMISLCPGCHAKVHRTIAVLTECPCCCWSYGESSTRVAMSKRLWTSRCGTQPCIRCQCLLLTQKETDTSNRRIAPLDAGVNSRLYPSKDGVEGRMSIQIGEVSQRVGLSVDTSASMRSRLCCRS